MEWMEKCDVGVSQVCLALHNPLFDFLDPTMLAIGVLIWHSKTGAYARVIHCP